MSHMSGFDQWVTSLKRVQAFSGNHYALAVGNFMVILTGYCNQRLSQIHCSVEYCSIKHVIDYRSRGFSADHRRQKKTELFHASSGANVQQARATAMVASSTIQPKIRQFRVRECASSGGIERGHRGGSILLITGGGEARNQPDLRRRWTRRRRVWWTPALAYQRRQ